MLINTRQVAKCQPNEKEAMANQNEAAPVRRSSPRRKSTDTAVVAANMVRTVTASAGPAAVAVARHGHGGCHHAKDQIGTPLKVAP